MENFINNKNKERFDKMKKIGVVGAITLVGLGLPAMMTPSALAYEGTMHSLTTMDMAYQVTETGYAVTVNAKDLATIEQSGINLEAYINEEFYLMIDEVFVDMSALFQNHGATEFNINIDKTADGFNYYLTVNSGGQQVVIDQIEGSSIIGQVTRDYLGTDIDSTLYHKDIQVQQMNYDGDLFVVFDAQGEYSLNPIELDTTQEVAQESIQIEEIENVTPVSNVIQTEDADILEVITYTSQESVVLYDNNPTGKTVEDASYKASSARDEEIIEVDDTLVVNALNQGGTTQDLDITEFVRKEKQSKLSEKTADLAETPKLEGDNLLGVKNVAVEQVKPIEIAPSIDGSNLTGVKNVTVEQVKPIEIAPTPIPTFTDIDGLYSQDAINNLVDKGIIEVKSTVFSPYKDITREQFALLVANVLKLSSSNAVAFTDMNESPYASKIQGLHEAGIFLGDNGTFNPNDSLSRQQASAVLVRTLKYKGYDTTKLVKAPNFKDSNRIALYAQESVGVLQSLGVIDGNPDGTFDPYGKLTNAQIAKMLNNTLMIVS